MLFYMVCTGSGELYTLATLEGHQAQEEISILLPGIPLGFAHKLQKAIQVRDKNKKKVEDEVLKFLRSSPTMKMQNWRWESVGRLEGKMASQNHALGSCTKGRKLSEVDLQRLARERGLSFSEILEYCEKQVQNGEAEWIPAVQKLGRVWQCMRCGETQVKEWPSIYGEVVTCPSCTALGALSSLHILYRSYSGEKLNNFSNRQDSNKDSFHFSPTWELSPAQKKVSHEILEFVSRNPARELLLWAACGAGKTEVCFPAAAWALNQGYKILFAAPRQDVVIDVAPRLKRDFPGIELSVLTGVSEERFSRAEFVLATTHQVLRFYKAFDLIFLDEMDAFPYHGNSALVWGLEQALKPSGKIVYLTATPSVHSLEKISQGQMHLIRLPARHHRKALPTPEWRKHSLDVVQGKFHIKGADKQRLAHWVKEFAQSGPVLLFVPKISWVDRIAGLLREEFPQWVIEGSYSSDPERRKKIDSLKTMKVRVFVSTSILERGVTIPKAQVLVLAADHEVFDERGLVQMAGRVGRTRENPGGRVFFLSKKRTVCIEKAIHWIIEQNALAFKQGLIDDLDDKGVFE